MKRPISQLITEFHKENVDRTQSNSALSGI